MMEFEFATEDRVLLVIELYYGMLPRTCENFIKLCEGRDGLHYLNSSVTRIVRGGK